MSNVAKSLLNVQSADRILFVSFASSNHRKNPTSASFVSLSLSSFFNVSVQPLCMKQKTYTIIMNKTIPVRFTFYITLLSFSRSSLSLHMCVCVSIILNCFFRLIVYFKEKKIFTDNLPSGFCEAHHQDSTMHREPWQ